MHLILTIIYVHVYMIRMISMALLDETVFDHFTTLLSRAKKSRAIPLSSTSSSIFLKRNSIKECIPTNLSTYCYIQSHKDKNIRQRLSSRIKFFERTS
jgi:hypothetical protein